MSTGILAFSASVSHLSNAFVLHHHASHQSEDLPPLLVSIIWIGKFGALNFKIIYFIQGLLVFRQSSSLNNIKEIRKLKKDFCSIVDQAVNLT